MSELQFSPKSTPKNGSSKGIKIKLAPNGWVLRLIGFFMAMAMPYPGIAPFGLSFLAQERKLSIGAVGSFIAVSLGAFAVCGRLGTTKYVSAGLIYLAVLFVLERGVRLNDFTAGLVAGAAVFFAGLVTLFFEGFTFFRFFLLVCEAVIWKVQPDIWADHSHFRAGLCTARRWAENWVFQRRMLKFLTGL